MQFKAAYIIDELNLLLEKIISKDVIFDFYSSKINFNITGLPEVLNFSDATPLLKTAWNIINRGEPTRSSLKIANFILEKNLGNLYSGLTSAGSLIKFNIDNSFTKEIDNSTLTDLLKNFNINQENIVYESGLGCFKIYSTLSELISIAQIQKTILLLLLLENTSNDIAINILGVNNEISNLIIDDLNELFQNLNNLIQSNEKKIPKLLKSNSKTDISISYNLDCVCNYKIDSFITPIENINDFILTDRRIKYKNLGKTRVEVQKEINDIGEEIEKNVHFFDFDTSELKASMLYFLQNIFRKTGFRPGQEAIIDKALIGVDVIGLLPTGGGKSLTYQICAILHPGVTIVIDPINSLMKDQYDKLIENGITKIAFINSFKNKEEKEQSIIHLKNSRYLLVFISPERFQIQDFRNSLLSCTNNNIHFSYAVIDEAHCVSEWGHDFRHVYLNLGDNINNYCKSYKIKKVPLIALTATASFDVLADVQRELKMPENAVISLPPNAIDRKELNFEIIEAKTGDVNRIKQWEREKKIGAFKYPIIDQILQSLPDKIKKLESKIGIINPNPLFFTKNIDNLFLNAGLIFCPTKSDTLHNGVVKLYKNLSENKDYLKIGTFIGNTDDYNTVENITITAFADKSYENQDEFIKNKSNLMIATKAFGMGIDKPNIRYTIHYTFPSSVESFYQEAGRAGRDRSPSISTIIYDKNDLQSNLDFFKNSFKGIERETGIINEILNEVKYEDCINLQILKAIVKEKYPEVEQIKFNNSNFRYLYVYGKFNANLNDSIKICLLDFHRNFTSYPNSTSNFDIIKAEEIRKYIEDYLIKECKEKNYAEWLNIKSSPGIKTMIDSNKEEKYCLLISFSNDVFSEITRLIIKSGYTNFKENITRHAYQFSHNVTDYVDKLKYRYKQSTGALEEELNLKEETLEYIQNNYFKIRDFADTQRMIYRMSIVGIIDDYEIDFSRRTFTVYFKSKTEKEYLKCFETYLRRYLGNNSTQEWIKKVASSQGESILHRVLYTVIDFINVVIAQKRKLSIDFMQSLCELGTQNGDKIFRENIVFYFASKYTRVDYLPKDMKDDSITNIEIIKKYIGFLYQAPDGLGSQLDNAKHLKGACEIATISMTDFNSNKKVSLDLLTCFCLFALDAKENMASDLNSPLLIKAIELYRTGFRNLLRLENESWDSVKDLLKMYNEKIIDLNPIISNQLTGLTNELLVNRTTYKLSKFLNYIS